MLNSNIKLLMVLATHLAIAGAPMSAGALESDKNQPATISADDVEFDFSTGTRTYRGNVKLDQGSMKLRADKLIVEYSNNVFKKATAYGQPAVFQQRPDNKPTDVIGKARRLEIDKVKNITTLVDNASLFDGEKNVSGQTIIYDMAKDKVNIKGNVIIENSASSGATQKQNGRSKITINPKERKQAKEKIQNDSE